MFSSRDSMKFLLFVFTYMGYPFVLYFAIMFSSERLSDHKNDFPQCRQMYVYSAIFLTLYIADALRYIIYVALSVFSHVFASNMGSGMFLVNAFTLTYGVLLVYTVENDCLTEYDIKDYLCVSGIGLLFSLVTYMYNNYDTYFKKNQYTSITQSLLYSNQV